MAFQKAEEEDDFGTDETDMERAMRIDNGEFVKRTKAMLLEKMVGQIVAERAGEEAAVDECPVRPSCDFYGRQR
jgi:hypothetical protein